MAAMNVTALSDLGYTETTRFIDPMEPRYRPKSFSDGDFRSRTGDFSDASIKQKVAFFNGLDAYRNVGAVESRLEAYWKTASSSRAGTATSSTQGTTLSTTARPTTTAGASTSGAAGSTSTRATVTGSTSTSRAATVSSSTARATTTRRAA